MTRKYRGTGLGLSISKLLVEQMEGEIGVESTQGAGCMIWFILKLEKCPHPQQSDNNEIGFQTVEKKYSDYKKMKDSSVLVVDDYPLNQEVAKINLEDVGILVSIVNNGKEAIKICESKQFDLILMDIQMPEMDGYAATECIRTLYSHYQNVPIIAITASADEQTKKKCFNSGFNDIIVKPIESVSFLSVIEKWMQSSKWKPNNNKDSQEEQNFNIENCSLQSQTQPLYYEKGISMVGGNEKQFKILLTQFVKLLPKQLQLLKSALEKKEADSLGKEAHKMRSGSASVGATPLSDMMGDLEEIANRGDLKEASILMGRIDDEVNRLNIFIANQKLN